MTLQIIMIVANLLICLGVPVVGTMVMAMRDKAPARPFLCGLLSYFLSGICVLGIAGLLFAGAAQKANLWLTGILGGVLLALAEEGIRYAMIRFSQKTQCEDWDGIAFGLGHGGLYGIWAAVLPNEVILMTILQTQKAAENISAWELLSAGIDVCSFLAFHIGISLLLYYGIKHNKEKLYFFLAVACNTLIRAMAQIWPELFPATSVLCELCIAILGVCVLAFGVRAVWNENHKEAKLSAVPNRKGRRKQK